MTGIRREIEEMLAAAQRSAYAPGTKAEREMLAAQEARLSLARRRELLELADLRGVPLHSQVRECALRSDLSGEAVAAVRAAVAWQRTNAHKTGGGVVLFLSGDPGCGKTVALAWQCAHYDPPPLARRPAGSIPGRAAKFAYAADVVRLGKAQFGPELAAAQELLGARLLCLDEAGLESDPSTLAEALIRRIAEERPTLLATNMTPTQIEERYFGAGAGAGRLQSRLAAQHLAGQPWIFACHDGDRRLEQ